MANCGNIGHVRDKLRGKRRRDSLEEEKMKIARNTLRRILLSMGNYPTTKVKPSGKTYKRSSARRIINAALQGA